MKLHHITLLHHTTPHYYATLHHIITPLTPQVERKKKVGILIMNDVEKNNVEKSHKGAGPPEI